jgi:DNA sulfur modification protein DndB
MTAEQISDRVDLAMNIRESKTLEDFLQRQLKVRVKKIQDYLLNNQSHFFSSIIIGVFEGIPDWYEFNLSKAYTKIPIITPSQASDLSESIGLLVLNGNEKMFAIDGQHRCRAIAEARSGRDGTKHLVDEQFSVILVPHVDNATGKKRTRRLFSDINKKAVPVSKGDLAIIDEEDLCAIVARRIYADYKNFRSGKIISLTESTNLPPGDDEHFTNLLTLLSTAKVLKKIYKKHPKSSDTDDRNIASFLAINTDFYDWAAVYTADIGDFFSGNKSIRELRVERMSFLLRPLGMSMLARIYADYRKADLLPKLSSNIGQIDFSLTGPHLNGLIWNGKRIEVKNIKLVFPLVKYLLGDLRDDELATFKSEYQRAMKNSSQLPTPLTLR